VTSTLFPYSTLFRSKASRTVLLKDLNGHNTVQLHATGVFAHYYWYKDGMRIDFPGSRDDTVRNPVFNPGACAGGQCEGNGIYTLVTAGPDGCPGPPSDPVHIVFNDLAPIRISTPQHFTGYAIKDGGVMLSWKDASSNESGFEIWRRLVIDETMYGNWQLAVLTERNATTFTDRKLIPSRTYHYKIRAVGNGIRSAYAPEGEEEYLVIHTLKDPERPTPPQHVSVTAPRPRQLRLTWSPSSDNVGI